MSKTAAAIAFLIASMSSSALAQDWPGWRGPGRDGVAVALAARKSLPESLRVKWKVEIGEGHSSPVVASGRVFTLSRKNDREAVSCFDLQTGRQIWTDSYEASYTVNSAAADHGKGPKSTPALGDGKLFTLGISGILSCYDAATGRLLWRKDFKDRYRYTSPHFGTASSPLYDRGLVIVNIGGHDAGALAAFDAGTGEAKWQWTEDGPGYASPIAVEFEGVRQVVTQTQQNIVGISAATGQLLWRIPFVTEYVQNIVTPLIYKNTIILSGLDKGTFAVKVTRRGQEWTTDTVWKNDAVPMYMNSPVVSDNLVFGLSHKNKGQYFCLDAATGKTVWTSQGRQGENAALLVGGQWLLSLNSDAELVAIKTKAAQFEAVKKYTVARSATWAHPAIINGGLLIKDATTLTLFSLD